MAWLQLRTSAQQKSMNSKQANPEWSPNYSKVGCKIRDY